MTVQCPVTVEASVTVRDMSYPALQPLSLLGLIYQSAALVKVKERL